MLATVIPPTTAPSGARKVDPTRGSTNSDVARQWASRPADQRFTSLTDLSAHVRAVRDRSAEAVVPVKQIEFIAPELRAQLDRLEPIRWPRAEKAGELARAAKRPAPAVKAADDGEGEGDA